MSGIVTALQSNNLEKLYICCLGFMSSWFVTLCIYYIHTVTVTQHSENVQYGVGSHASRKPVTAPVTECQYMS
jgi:hypothetical protein